MCRKTGYDDDADGCAWCQQRRADVFVEVGLALCEPCAAHWRAVEDEEDREEATV